MATYRCPFCGKEYTSRIGMSKCAAACAEALDKRDAAIRENEQIRQRERERKAQLEIAEKNIDAAYAELQKAISDYHTFGGTKNIQVRMTRTNGTQNSDFLWNTDGVNSTKGKRAQCGILDEYREMSEKEKKDLEKFLQETLDIKSEKAPKKESPVERLERLAKESGETGYESDMAKLKETYGNLSGWQKKFADEITTALLDSFEENNV